ncbi:MAG: hypothetical protein ACM3SY_22235 [Candidatus Omnitrophota bacterium]
MTMKDNVSKQKKERPETTINKDILEAMDKAFPDDVIRIDSPDGSYLVPIIDQLREKLSEIKSVDFCYERDWQGNDFQSFKSEGEEEIDEEIEDEVDEEGEGEEDEAETDDELDESEDHDESYYSASYHLFFFALDGEQYQYKCEAEFDDDDSEQPALVNGTGTLGCSIGVSLLGPYAVVKVDSIEFYEDDSHSLPDITPAFYDTNEEAMDDETEYRDMIGNEAMKGVDALREEIENILKSFKIKVLPEEELNKNVPWLTAGEDMFIEPGHPVTVKDALFFSGEF